MFTQYALPYASDALEPYIDALTVETHHGKHHKTYTANFNAACEKAGITDSTPIEEILSHLSDIKDEGVRKAVRNNGGGFYNHNLYFSHLSPNPAKAPKKALAEAIDKTFGSLDAVIEKLSAAAAGQFGSGWAYLAVTADKKLVITTTSNQDTPFMEGMTPILALDVWEHAYYLKYKNLRAEYIKNFFAVLDWAVVSDNYEKAIG